MLSCCRLQVKKVFKENGGTSVQTLKKPAAPTLLAHCQFMGKNKQLTLLSQCELAFIGRNVLMALKIRRDSNKIKKNRRDAYSGLDLSIYIIKSPARETVPLNITILPLLKISNWKNKICDCFQENGDPGNSHRYTTGLFPEHFATHREYTDKKTKINLHSFDKGLTVTMKKHPSCFKLTGELANINSRVQG